MFDLNQVKYLISEDSEHESHNDLIPLFSKQEEDEMNREEIPDQLPILPLRNTVLFPGVVIPITVGRDKSIKLIRDANKSNKIIGVCAQLDGSMEDPEIGDIYQMGTVAHIVRMLRMPDGNTTVILQGRRRFMVGEVVQTEPYLRAKSQAVTESRQREDKEFKAIMASIREIALQIIDLSPNIPSEAGMAIR